MSDLSEELSKIAYSMYSAYHRNSNIVDAVNEVAELYPGFDSSNVILSAMWFAIDATYDLQSK